uniref:Uncharacterized protein n=1 Tax=Trieres chinensis TaxID=1514140 RepID=A0A7S1ZSM6_TRICV|mmetsp:Transcript_31624/g.64622  ORF Transcript_31624/g.64622 Transcript_31624/m.64622 type:complete len:148 (+) Transcript_31624:344-787(+)
MGREDCRRESLLPILRATTCILSSTSHQKAPRFEAAEGRKMSCCLSFLIEVPSLAFVFSRMYNLLVVTLSGTCGYLTPSICQNEMEQHSRVSKINLLFCNQTEGRHRINFEGNLVDATINVQSRKGRWYRCCSVPKPVQGEDTIPQQ